MGSLEEFEQYKSFSIEELKEATASKEIFMNKLTEGETDLRILPPPMALNQWFADQGLKPTPFVELWKHFFQTPSGEYMSFPCPHKTAGLPCAACELSDRLRSSQNEEVSKAGWSMRSQRKILITVINRDRPEDGPRLWEVSAPAGKALGKTMFEKIMGVMQGRRPKNIVTPGEEGYDIAVTRTGTGRDTSYTVEAGEQRPLSDTPEEAVALINSQPDVRDCFKIPGEDIVAEKIKEMQAFANGGQTFPPALERQHDRNLPASQDDEDIPF